MSLYLRFISQSSTRLSSNFVNPVQHFCLPLGSLFYITPGSSGHLSLVKWRSLLSTSSSEESPAEWSNVTCPEHPASVPTPMNSALSSVIFLPTYPNTCTIPTPARMQCHWVTSSEVTCPREVITGLSDTKGQLLPPTKETEWLENAVLSI